MLANPLTTLQFTSSVGVYVRKSADAE